MAARDGRVRIQTGIGRGGGGGRGRGRGRGGGGVRTFPPPHEIVRVASKKIKNGGVCIHALCFRMYTTCTHILYSTVYIHVHRVLSGFDI